MAGVGDLPNVHILLFKPYLVKWSTKGGEGSKITATPNQNENAKTTAPSNFDAEAFGDMFSTLYNQI